ncbi:DUF1080 domain-containing protein [Adhaeribacter swui]|uniref:DUF1080 domain-containing protein n=1 Tax=Adhaeribacter swui TaxID=2086471 RepID=A0A7G7G7V8_9BACT|nr:DUF1080 domain-containing protein [Adhaeribacter swui]QNF33242.1 DUF1080 domain-containing protein [Adhaeribacter swui]
MKTRKIIYCFSLLIWLFYWGKPDVFAQNPNANKKDKQTFTSLFDGHSLRGWHQIPGGNWQVVNGAIVGTSTKDEKRHGLLVSDKVYKDFTVKLKFRPITGNSGFYFRCEETNDEVGVHGFQAEIDPEKDAGGLYETGGREWVVQPKPEDVKRWLKPGLWNDMTIIARGGNVVVFINGYKTAAVSNDPGRTEGHLALQLHGGQDMDVLFKDIQIAEE